MRRYAMLDFKPRGNRLSFTGQPTRRKWKVIDVMRACQSISIALTLLLPLGVMPALSQDIERGSLLFNEKCSYCHSLSPKMGPKLATPPKGQVFERDVKREPDVDWSIEVGKDKRGPHLQGLFGRPPGAVKGFPYRITMETENPVWTDADLDYWIFNHARIGDADRRDLIAYLKRATRE